MSKVAMLLKILKLSQSFIKLLFNRCCNRRVFIFILCLPLIIYYSVQFYFEFIPPPVYLFKHTHMNSQCIIPDIDPFDDHIMKHYIWHPDPIVCDDTPSLLYLDYDGILQINKSVYPNSKQWDLLCTYSIVELIDDNNVKFLPELKFTPPVYIETDVFLVQCKKNRTVVFKDLFQKVDFKSLLKEKHIENENDEKLSIFMFGLDSISRLTAIRKLPKTMKYLQETLKAYVFKGHNKIADNTYPNLIALLTGKFDREHKVNEKKEYMEKFNFIWSNFSEAHYVTMHGEDWPEIATFNMGCKGFGKQPTDHYQRRFFLAMRKVQPYHLKVEQVFLFLERYVQLRKRSALCFGNRKIHMIVLEYCKQFMEAYRGKLRFNFGWLTELSHNFINFIEVADQDFYELFKWLHEKQHLNRTVLIFYGDHGSRQDEIRNTYIGRIEDRMPLFSIVIPEHIKQKYPHIHQNLLSNTETLTTPFDAFQTISDVLHGNFANKNSPHPTKPPWGKSLFERISKNRTCFEANIPENYCSCYAQTQIDVTSKEVVRLGNYIRDEINRRLQILKDKCSTLALKQIKNATFVSLPLQRTKVGEIFTLRNLILRPETAPKQRYIVTIETVPGGGLFEATIDFHPSSEHMEVIGNIDRINNYGNQSSCIFHRSLRLYCYCK